MTAIGRLSVKKSFSVIYFSFFIPLLTKRFFDDIIGGVGWDVDPLRGGESENACFTAVGGCGQPTEISALFFKTSDSRCSRTQDAPGFER